MTCAMAGGCLTCKRDSGSFSTPFFLLHDVNVLLLYLCFREIFQKFEVNQYQLGKAAREDSAREGR